MIASGIATLQALLLVVTFGGFVDARDVDLDIEGNVYVVDAGSDRLIRYGTEGDSIGSIGGFGDGEEEFDQPVAVCASRGNDIYVADYGNHRIQRFDRSLDFIATLRTRDAVDERVRFGYPLDVAVSRQGDVHILDGENRRLLVVTPAGAFIRTIGDVGAGEGRMVDPQRLELDQDDNVYVLDDGAVKVYDPFGAWLRRLPLPSGLTPRSLAVDGDTLVVTGDSTLFIAPLADLSAGRSHRVDHDIVAARTREGFLLLVGKVRGSIRKLTE